MPTLLHIDSSPLYERSVSRQLTEAFVTQWKSSIRRGLSSTATLTQPRCRLSPPSGWVLPTRRRRARTPQQKEVLALSDTLLAELAQANEYVFGVPMHNFGRALGTETLD